jgi:hypothetical protein
VNKKPKLQHFIIFVSLVFIVFIGMNLTNVNKSLNATEQCILSNNACLFSNDTLDLSIVFKQTPIIEEEMFIDFTLSSDFAVTKAWIEGESMYMGKIPVTIKAVNNQATVEGVTFLGSCSQPKMQWRLLVEVKNKQADQTFVYSALFSTRRT